MVNIQPYTDDFKEQMVIVWEKSVRSTHGFLSNEDLNIYKNIVSSIDFNAFSVFCLIRDEQVIGFIGVAESKIEMLFLLPEFIGKGFGKLLIDFAITELKADKVDVNEQNFEALNFYLKCGFVQYNRTDKDDLGKPYPLLNLKLEKI